MQYEIYNIQGNLNVFENNLELALVLIVVFKFLELAFQSLLLVDQKDDIEQNHKPQQRHGRKQKIHFKQSFPRYFEFRRRIAACATAAISA